jgi:hypothetical protein
MALTVVWPNAGCGCKVGKHPPRMRAQYHDKITVCKEAMESTTKTHRDVHAGHLSGALTHLRLRLRLWLWLQFH